MPETEFQFCDVALPVPVDRTFTYELPPTLRHRVRAGCRVVAPFGPRKLTGVVLRTHNTTPGSDAREVLSLRDEEPVLDTALIELAQWIAEYYCAPIGEVLKGMLPLGGETRRSTIYSLTAAGRDVARQLIIRPGSDPSFQLLAALAERERPLESLKIDNAKTIARSLIKRGWVVAEDKEADRDPLRAPAEKLSAEFKTRPADTIKLRKAERELIAFLELHPGPHNLAEVAKTVKNASGAARSLAHHELIMLSVEGLAIPAGYERPTPQLNLHQQAAFEAIKAAIADSQFKTFLLQGVTGSGKTEVYLSAIEAALRLGRNALLLVPEIALTPAVAGQFFHRFGKQVCHPPLRLR